MRRRNRWNKSTSAGIVLLAVLAVSAPVQARDKEFGLLVRHVESYYHAKRSHRFLLGFAGLVVRVWRPEGVRGFRIALFEDQDFSAARSDHDFPAVVGAGLRDGWQPLVRVYSRREGEHTVIFAKGMGNDLKLLIATVEPREAVVMEMRLNPDKLSDSIHRWSRDERGSCDVRAAEFGRARRARSESYAENPGLESAGDMQRD